MSSQKTQIADLNKVGIVRDTAPHALPANAFSDGQNIRFVNEGVEKRKGTAKIFEDTTSTNQMILMNYFADPVGERYIRTMRDTSFSPNRIKLESISEAGVATAITLNTYATSFLEFVNSSNSDFQSDVVAGGQAIIVNNGFHTPHVIQSGSNAASEIPGWNYDTTNDGHTSCKVIKSFKDVLIAGNLTKYTTVTTDGSDNITDITTSSGVVRQPSAIRVSSLAGPGEIPQLWDPSAAGSKPSDEFEISSTSPIQDIIELQGTAIIYTNDSIHSVQIDSRNNINVQNITKSHGLLAMGLVTEFNGQHLVVGSDDIYIFSGSSASIKSVAESRVKEYFFDNLNPGYLNNAFVVNDKMTSEVKIFFPNKKSFSGKCNEYLAWNYKNNTWSINTCEDIIDATVGPIPGGGLPTETVTFDGVGNAAATGQAEVQRLTIDLGSGNTLTPPTNQTESLAYQGSNSATFLATNATVGIDDAIIPTNQEQYVYTLETNASTGGTQIEFADVNSNASVATIPKTSLAVSVNSDFTETNQNSVTSKNGSSWSSATTDHKYNWPAPSNIFSFYYLCATSASTLTDLTVPPNNSAIILEITSNTSTNTSLNVKRIIVNIDGVIQSHSFSGTSTNFIFNTQYRVNVVLGSAGTLATNRRLVNTTPGFKGTPPSSTNYTASVRYYTSATISYYDPTVDYVLSGVRTGDRTIFDTVGTAVNSTENPIKNANGTITTYVPENKVIEAFSLEGSVIAQSVTGVGDQTNLDDKPEVDLNVSLVSTVAEYSPPGNNATNINLATPSIVTGVEFVEINSTQSEVRVVNNYNSSSTSSYAVFRFNTPATTPIAYTLNENDIVLGTMTFPVTLEDSNNLSLTINLNDKMIRNTVEKSGFIGTFSTVAYNMSQQKTTFRLTNNGSSSDPTNVEFVTGKVSVDSESVQGSLNFGQSVTLTQPGDTTASQWTVALGEAANFSFSDDNGSIISNFALTQQIGATDIAAEIADSINNLSNSTYSASSSNNVLTIKNAVSSSQTPLLTFIENDGRDLEKEFKVSPISEVGSLPATTEDFITWVVRDNRIDLYFNKGVPAGQPAQRTIYTYSEADFLTKTSAFFNEDFSAPTSANDDFPFPTTIGDFTYALENDYIERGTLQGTFLSSSYYSVLFKSDVAAGEATRVSPGTSFPQYTYTIDDGVNSQLSATYSPTTPTDTSTIVAEGLRDHMIAYFNNNKQGNQSAWSGAATVSNNDKKYGVIDFNNETTLSEFVIGISTNANPDAPNSSAVLTGAEITGSQTGNVLRLFEPNNSTAVLDVQLTSNESTSTIISRIVDVINNNLQSPINYSATNNTSESQVDIVGSSVNTQARWTTQYLAANNGNSANGDFLIDPTAAVTVVGKPNSVKLKFFEPRTQGDVIIALTQTNNNALATELTSKINEVTSGFYANWQAAVDTAVGDNVIKLTFNTNDFVLPANYPTVRDVDYSGPNGNDGRAIYVKEVIYDSSTIDNSSIIPEGSTGLTMATQLSQFSGTEFTRGQPDIVGTKVTVLFEGNSFTSQPAALSATPAQMGLVFADMINSDVPALSAVDNTDGTVSVSSNNLTINSFVLDVGFDESSDENSVNRAERSNPPNWPTASVATDGTTIDSERPWSLALFNNRQRYLVTISDYVTSASNIGYTFNSSKLPSDLSNGTPYTSFLERTHFSVGDFSTIKQFNYLQALVTQGDLGICVNTINSPGETVSELRTQTKKPFHIQEEYKIDIRKPASAEAERVFSAGRMVNVCFTDLVGEYNSIQYSGTTPWRISGYGFDYISRESRSESKD
jgi:hypothetical protein